MAELFACLTQLVEDSAFSGSCCLVSFCVLWYLKVSSFLGTLLIFRSSLRPGRWRLRQNKLAHASADAEEGCQLPLILTLILSLRVFGLSTSRWCDFRLQTVWGLVYYYTFSGWVFPPLQPAPLLRTISCQCPLMGADLLLIYPYTYGVLLCTEWRFLFNLSPWEVPGLFLWFTTFSEAMGIDGLVHFDFTSALKFCSHAPATS